MLSTRRRVREEVKEEEWRELKVKRLYEKELTAHHIVVRQAREFKECKTKIMGKMLGHKCQAHSLKSLCF